MTTPRPCRRCLDYARQVNAGLRDFQVSASHGDGLADWYAWLGQQAALQELEEKVC